MSSGTAAAHVVDCAAYVDGQRLAGAWTPDSALAEVRRRRAGFVWVGLYEPDDAQLAVLADTFGLSDDLLSHTAGHHHRPRLTWAHDDLLCMVLKTVHYVASESPTTANEIVDTGEIIAFLGHDFVVTVRRGPDSGLAELRAELAAAPERLRLGPAAVLHGIVDRVVDSYVEVSAAFELDIDTIEASVFDPDTSISTEQLYLVKREIVELNRATTPLAEPLRRLLDTTSRLVPGKVRAYFRDTEDHLTTVAERVAGLDDLLTTLLAVTLAKISLQQNTDMRKITAWAAILAVPTMVVGVFGMNFDFMPELRWQYGYPATLLLTLLACVILFRVLSRNRWL
jgi:magnesium transporter